MARPKKITNEILQKLEEGFMSGLSDREACVYADICEGTLYNYCKKNKGFLERKEMLKDAVKMRAKINISKKISEGDIELSKYYLERKCKNEFSAKSEVELSGSINNPFAGLTTDDLKKLVNSE